MIERLAAGAAGEQRARDVDHMRRARAFVNQWRTASPAKAARGFRGLVLEARDLGFALGDPKAFAPASDIGRIRRTVRAPAAERMIVPGPACRRVDRKADATAQALTCDGLADGGGFRIRRHACCSSS